MFNNFFELQKTVKTQVSIFKGDFPRHLELSLILFLTKQGTRWMQLGSFYPFMRNHNDDRSKDQDPAVFDPDTVEAMRKSLHIRYTLLPYLYTLFYRSSVFGETVVRGLFFEFYQDQSTFQIDKQFMFGPAFMISPVLTQVKIIYFCCIF